jgi:hypothetical protein
MVDSGAMCVATSSAVVPSPFLRSGALSVLEERIRAGCEKVSHHLLSMKATALHERCGLKARTNVSSYVERKQKSQYASHALLVCQMHHRLTLFGQCFMW